MLLQMVIPTGREDRTELDRVGSASTGCGRSLLLVVANAIVTIIAIIIMIRIIIAIRIIVAIIVVVIIIVVIIMATGKKSLRLASATAITCIRFEVLVVGIRDPACNKEDRLIICAVSAVGG